MRRVLRFIALAALAGACARAYPPPGGEQDRTPPRLVSVTPEPLAVLSANTDPVVFTFDERLSERGFAESLVVVSPLDGAIRVDRGRRDITVRIDGGWRANRVYRVIVLPGIRDLFGNARTDPAEVVFSTGPPVPSTAIAGIVNDRLSGRAAQNAIVTAVRRADSVSYMAMADSSGFFALRHLPLGAYDLHAFSDQNRNRRHDFAEPIDSGAFVSLGSPTDTFPQMFTVLVPDTTPPQLRSAAAADSLHVRLTFDDYLDVDSTATHATGRVLLLPDSTVHDSIAEVMHPTVWERSRRPVVTDPATTDTTTRRAPPPPQPQEPAEPLPNRDVIVSLTRPLQPGEYVVVILNAVNINGLTGGGAARFEVRAQAGRAPSSSERLRRQ